MTAKKTVTSVIASLDKETAADSRVLIALMKQVSGCAPKTWNVGTIGFDTYHYKYESGREGDCHVLGFYPRASKTTIYLMDGTKRYSTLLAKLGKYKKTGYCLYFTRLSDVKLPVLKQILSRSYKEMKSRDGRITSISWK